MQTIEKIGRAARSGVRAGTEMVQQVAKESVLPTAGAGLGMRFGAAMTRGNPVAALMGAFVAGMGGEVINQVFGVTEPSEVQKLLAGITFPTTRGIVATRAALPPTTRGAILVNRLAKDEFDQFMKDMAPAQASRTLFKLAEKAGGNIKIVTPKSVNAVDEAITELSSRLEPPSGIISTLSRLRGRMSDEGFALPLHDVNQFITELGDTIGSIPEGQKRVLALVGRVRRALDDDLDLAINQNKALGLGIDAQTISVLKAARKASLREKTLDEIKELGEAATRAPRGVGEVRQFNSNAVINRLRKNDFYERAFDAGERREIEALLNRLNSIPRIKIDRSNFIQEIVGRAGSGAAGGAGIGAAAGVATGAELEVTGMMAGAGAAIGSTANVVLPPLVDAIDIIKNLLAFRAGRKLLATRISGTSGKLTKEDISFLAQGLVMLTTPGTTIETLLDVGPANVTIEPRGKPATAGEAFGNIPLQP